MSQYVGVEPKQYPAIHCSPTVLIEALTPAIDPKILAGLIGAEGIQPRHDRPRASVAARPTPRANNRSHVSGNAG